MSAAIGWQDAAAWLLAAAGLWLALRILRRSRRAHDCSRCALRPGQRELHPPPPRG